MNLEPFISQLTILDKNVRLKKLELNWAQREYSSRPRAWYGS
jgi:hypothetical protein